MKFRCYFLGGPMDKEYRDYDGPNGLEQPADVVELAEDQEYEYSRNSSHPGKDWKHLDLVVYVWVLRGTVPHNIAAIRAAVQ